VFVEQYYLESTGFANQGIGIIEIPEERGDDLPPIVVDDRLFDAIWTWLVSHRDTEIGTRERRNIAVKINNTISTPTVVEQPTQFHYAATAVLPNPPNRDQNATVSEIIHTPMPTASFAPENSEATEIFMRTTCDRMWQAIAGHGIDYSKIRALEFDLLTIIASHGEQGVSQPDVIARSGQDKRSLPHRTDILHNNGYIEKKVVQLRGCRTSLLTLKKFVRTSTAHHTDAGVHSAEPLQQQVFRNGMILTDEFLEITLQLLKRVGAISLANFRKWLVCGLFM